jgi:putative sterol carrier protein
LWGFFSILLCRREEEQNIMALRFATDAWIKALGDELNASEKYAQSAKTWEGDFYLVVENGRPEDEICLYLDLWHGKCRDAYAVTDRSQKTPAFVMSAPYAAWKKVVLKQLDPIKGLMMRQLKLAGDMGKIMRAPQAAKELVECVAKIDTEFPE